MIRRSHLSPFTGLFTTVSLSLFSLAFLAGCGSSDFADRQTVTVTGSSTVAPLVSQMAKQYEKQHPNVRIDVQAGGSSRGLKDVRTGLSDLGMVSREIKATESDIQAHLVAIDGIALIVNSANPIKRLTEKQIVAIYTKKIINWQELGGSNNPIIVINKAEGRSTLEVFLKYFSLNSQDIKADAIIGSNAQGISTVAGNPYAIGYISIGAAEFEINNGTPIRALPLKGIAATTKNLASGQFPLARQLNVISLKNKKQSQAVNDFIAYIQSDEVASIVSELSFVKP